jgi:hypothetical protein
VRRKRGRPPKFGRPSEVVALTLPEEVVRGLRQIHPDIAWAVVTLFEGKGTTRVAKRTPDAELVTIGGRQSLIVINAAVFTKPLRTLLHQWRHDRTLRFHTRAIIVADRVRSRLSD